MGGYIGSKASVVSSGAERKKHFAITATTTSLTGLTYTPTMVHVYHNGIRLVDGTDFTATDGSTITLTNAAENGDDVVVVSFATFQTSDTVSKSAGGTFAGNVTHTGDLNVGTIKDETGTNTAITINSSGDVGIKTSSPTRPLSITDQTNDGSGGIILSSYLPTLEMDDISGGGTSFMLQHDQTNTILKHDTTERMRITGDGVTQVNQLGLGTTGTDTPVLIHSKMTSSSTLNFDFVVDVDTGSWTPFTLFVSVGSIHSNQARPRASYFVIRGATYNGSLGAVSTAATLGDTSDITVTVSDQGGTDPMTIRVQIGHPNNRVSATVMAMGYMGIQRCD